MPLQLSQLNHWIHELSTPYKNIPQIKQDTWSLYFQKIISLKEFDFKLIK